MPDSLGLKQQCLPCPTGAVCGGMGSRQIAALEGYRRLEWSYGQIGFIRCETEGVCRGVPAQVQTEAEVAGMPPQMQLRPETQLRLALAQTNGNQQVAEALVRLWRLSGRTASLVSTGSDLADTFRS